MAQDQATVVCAINTWTQLTNANATSITFQPDNELYIRGTVGASAPSDQVKNGIHYDKDQGEANRPLTDVFTASGVNRVYARPIGKTPVSVYVDHA